MTIGQLELYIFELMKLYNNSVRAFAIEHSKQTEKIVKYPIMKPCFYGDSEIPEKHKAAKKGERSMLKEIGNNLYYFRAKLVDDAVDRDNERFTRDAVRKMADADYCTALLEQNKELKHAVRHCYNAMSEFEDITRELEEYL